MRYNEKKKNLKYYIFNKMNFKQKFYWISISRRREDISMKLDNYSSDNQYKSQSVLDPSVHYIKQQREDYLRDILT